MQWGDKLRQRQKDNLALAKWQTSADGSLFAEYVGYDLDQPRELGLYRRLAAVPVLEAMKRGIPLNLSAGVGRFKALRGGEPVMEYLGVYVRHLPATRRAPWRAVHELSTRLLAPHVQKHGL